MPAKVLSVNYSVKVYHYLIKRAIHIIVLYSLSISGLWAQTKTAILKIIPENHVAREMIIEQFQYSDTLQLINSINQNISRLHEQGYLLASQDNIIPINDSLNQVNINAGEQFKWAKLSSGNLPEQLLTRVGYREPIYRDEPFKIKQINTLFNSVIQNSQNNGFPFAWIALDSVKIEGFMIKASVQYSTGPLISFDSLKLNPGIAVKPAWLGAYLGVIPGKPFDQSVVDKIEQKIERLDFLKLTKPAEVRFENEKASITLDLKKVPSNKIDGIIGFLPNEKATGGTLITGQFDMGLTNLFNSGKSLGVHWQSLKPRSQLLRLNYLHRNLLHSPLHFSASFYLLKEDTTFINRKGELAFHYQPASHDLSFFTRFESSRLISNEISDTYDPGALSDFNINYYGLDYSYSSLTNTRVPRGFVGNLELAVGNKSISNYSNLPPEVANNIEKKSTQFSAMTNADWLQPVSKLFGVLLKVSGGKLINDQLFINDLFRLGGLQSIRGFNENFFYASEYLIGTAELRLYYEQNSYLFLFYDQSYLYYRIRENKFEDYPLGIGVGLSLQTKGGILNLAYALGKSQEQPLSLSLSKFHFGYVANF